VRLLRILVVAASLAGCAGPPQSAYVGSSSRSDAQGVGLGRNGSGEACTQQVSGAGADIFCGTWDQPSGHVAKAEGSPADLRQVAVSSRWRNALDNRFECGEPASTTILGNTPAFLLNCTRKIGGWPQAALVAAVDGQVYVADGILPALPVLERSVGILSGRVSAQAAPAMAPGSADALLASRLAAQAFSAGDIGQYQQLMLAGSRANLAESFVAAERAYRAAYNLQRKALGVNDPNTAIPLMLVALQLSDEGRTVEADDAFSNAARLVAQAADATALPRLQHYRGLNALNENKPAEALALLRAAEAGYTALLPQDMLALRPLRAAGPLAVARRGGGSLTETSSDSMLLEPDQQTALIGVIETRRYEAITLRELGRSDDAKAMIRSAEALSAARGLQQRDLTARLYRTASIVDNVAQRGSGYDFILRASRDFALAQPGTRPLAQTLLLRADQELQSGSLANALDLCRRGSALLREIKAGTSIELLLPCLSTFAAEADQQPAQRQALLAEMFAASQLVQGSITVQQIAQASARLSESAKDPRIGAAIRRQQDASLALAEIQRRFDTATQQGGRVERGGETLSLDELAKQVAAAQTALSDADAALQAASPNYGQLVQEVVPAQDVLAALAPGEAFVSMSLAPESGWMFLLRDGEVSVAPAKAGSTAITALVKRVRATIEPTRDTPPPFDIAASQAIYSDTLGQFGPRLDGLTSLTVAPVGSLLSLPFGLLLTGPATQDGLATAPWLIQKVAISHVPAPANFISLRRAAAVSRATQPWFGFGDFRPVTVQQAEQTFPSASCEDSAKLFAGLPPLPFARRELEASRLLLGGSPADSLEGVAFNTPRVMQQDLHPYRVLHFATHALLPSDLRCQTEPAIVTSDPPGATNANGALLTSSDVTAMQLDADVVILSACNSGGPNGETSGESLSGLARAFFYAGARALMVTHWSVNDQATAFLVAGTLKRVGSDHLGVAEALRQAQLSMLAGAGHTLPASIAHPFYWAPFALVGEGRGRALSAKAGAADAGLNRMQSQL
jgi:CHAT domain-containing protein